MSTTHTYAFILGNHTRISLAELEAVFAAQSIDAQVTRREGIALVETAEKLDAESLMIQLGGTIKIAELVGAFEPEAVIDWLYEQIDHSSKFHFGFSEYAIDPGVGIKKDWKTLHKLGLTVKRVLKEDGISCRYVQSKEIVLSSVIVHKERLLKNGVEVVVLKGKNELLFARTLAVQPFQAFSKRDYGRPQVDAKSGMLPPKLARMMVNLSGAAEDDMLLDPFCGSGTVLQEAASLGIQQLIGNDLSPKAIQDTEANMAWLKKEQIADAEIELHVGSAVDLISGGVLDEASVDRIVFEGYLGPTTPNAEQLPAAMKELQSLYEQTFPVLGKLVRPGGVVVAALPFWMISVVGKGGKPKYVPRYLDKRAFVEASGLQLVADELTYRRPTATVGRDLLILKKAA